MSMESVISKHIEVVPGDRESSPCIAGRRIRVEDIVIWHEKLGFSPREIVAQYPDIGLADVYAALTYYHDHREAIDLQIREKEARQETQKATQSATQFQVPPQITPKSSSGLDNLNLKRDVLPSPDELQNQGIGDNPTPSSRGSNLNTCVSKWENELTISIPHMVAAQARLEEGTKVEIAVFDDKVVVTPVAEMKKVTPSRYSLSELLEAVTSNNLHGEICTGDAVGCEIW